MSYQDRPSHPDDERAVGSMSVQDLFLLDDLRSLRIPWLVRLIDGCKTHEDVERMWMQIRCWGPDHDDVEEMFQLSTHSSRLQQSAEKLRKMVHWIESWRP